MASKFRYTVEGQEIERGQAWHFADGREGVVSAVNSLGVTVYVGPQVFLVPASDVDLVFSRTVLASVHARQVEGCLDLRQTTTPIDPPPTALEKMQTDLGLSDVETTSLTASMQDLSVTLTVQPDEVLDAVDLPPRSDVPVDVETGSALTAASIAEGASFETAAHGTAAFVAALGRPADAPSGRRGKRKR